MARTERKSESRKEMADLLVLPRPAESLQNSEGFSGELTEWRRLQRKSLNILSLPKRRVASVPQRKQLARTLEPLLPKGEGTEASFQRTRSQRGGVQVRESRTLMREREGSERNHGKERVSSTVKEGRFQDGEGEQAKRTFLEQVEESMSG